MDINRFKDIMPLHKFSPFWGWNGKLDKAELSRQIDEIKDKGLPLKHGGLAAQCRTLCHMQNMK